MPPDAVQCSDPTCRKRLPAETRFCPYCGTPIWQSWLSIIFGWLKIVLGVVIGLASPRWGVVIVLIALCSGVYCFLGTQLQTLLNQSAFSEQLATDTPTATATSSPTATPFPKFTVPPTATDTPTPPSVRVIEITVPANERDELVNQLTAIPTLTSTPVQELRATVGEVASLRPNPDDRTVQLIVFFGGEQLLITGRTANNRWLKANYDGQTGWVKAELVELDGSIDALPLVE